jgi:TonB family protein
MEAKNMLRSVLVIALFATSHLLAADFNGKWAGIFETDGNRVPIYLTVNVNNEGKITGFVATGRDTKQVPIEKGEPRGEELSFEIHDNANRLMLFRLALNGGVLGGDATVGGQVSKIAVVPVSGQGDRVGSGASGTSVGSGFGSGPFRVGGGVTPPTLLHKTEPEYTEEAKAAKFQGTVVLYIEVGPDGTATNIKVQHSLGMGLDEKAIEAVRKWQFLPGKKDGKPVTVAATIEVNFRLPD